MRNLTRTLQIFLWSYVFIYIVICSLHITQVDLWWQLSEGLRILQTWSLPVAPVTAFGLPATPYFDEYAGYEVVLATLFKIGGFPVLWAVFAAVYLAIIFLPIATSGHKHPSFDIFSTAALLFAGILMKVRLEQRPELVGGLLLVLLMATLRKANLEKITPRILLSLFLIFVAWTNTHSTFIIGFFVLGLWGGSEMLLKYRKFPFSLLLRGSLWAGGTALFATVLNPYGPRRLLFPFLQALDPGSTALSVEMWPTADLSPIAGLLVAITIALLAWGIFTTRGLPLWLIIFSIFSVFISIKSFRFINLLAISTLFIYAARTEDTGQRRISFPLPLVLLRDMVLCLLCVFFIFGDAFSYIFTYVEMRGLNHLARHDSFFAPEVCAIRVSDSKSRVPVLCGHGTGSYLSFDGTSQFRPLLDSGLSHFSDDTKRYFFFLWHDCDALDFALQHLNVNYIILNKENFAWVPVLHRSSDWKLVDCDSRGMLWKRRLGGPYPLSSLDRESIERSVSNSLQEGEVANAFDYSTLLDDPDKSLGILEQFQGRGFTEVFFNSLCVWIRAVPAAVIEDFLARPHSLQYPLIDALLSARLGPDVYAKFVATDPPGPRPWFWKVLEIRECLQKGDQTQGRTIFDSISPVPASSVLYYKLWHQVRSGDPASNVNDLTAYGRWQTWDDDAKLFMQSMSNRLNERMVELDRQPAP